MKRLQRFQALFLFFTVKLASGAVRHCLLYDTQIPKGKSDGTAAGSIELLGAVVLRPGGKAGGRTFRLYRYSCSPERPVTCGYGQPSCVVVKLFCNICGLNLLDCCLEAIGTVRFYQWCFAPLRGHAIDQICHFRFFAITQSNQETCFRRPLCCCPHLVWCAVTVIAMWAHMIVGSIGEFLHRVIEFLFRPKFVQIRAFVL